LLGGAITGASGRTGNKYLDWHHVRLGLLALAARDLHVRARNGGREFGHPACLRISNSKITGVSAVGTASARIPLCVYWWSDETDPEYDLRFDADEEYIRELIDRIDEMSLHGVKLCNRCTEKHPGSGKGNPARRSALSAIGMLSDILFWRRCGCVAEDEPQCRVKPMNGN
jgi:hypothetical protein